MYGGGQSRGIKNCTVPTVTVLLIFGLTAQKPPMMKQWFAYRKKLETADLSLLELDMK